MLGEIDPADEEEEEDDDLEWEGGDVEHGDLDSDEDEPDDDFFPSAVNHSAWRDVPVVMPRQRCVGARNVRTVKDGTNNSSPPSSSSSFGAVNFVGPEDEFVRRSRPCEIKVL